MVLLVGPLLSCNRARLPIVTAQITQPSLLLKICVVQSTMPKQSAAPQDLDTFRY